MNNSDTLLNIISLSGLDPTKDEDVLQFIDKYWTHTYDIDNADLNKLKLLFVNQYMFYEIAYPEMSLYSPLSPIKQWGLLLNAFLRSEEDWYLNSYKMLKDIDPLEFTEAKVKTEGGNDVTGVTTGNSSNISDSNSSGTSNNTATGNATNNSNTTANSESKNDATGKTTSHGTSDNRNANGVGTLDGFTNPVAVTNGNRVVANSTIAGAITDGLDNSESHSDGTGKSESTNDSTSNSDSTSNGKSSGTAYSSDIAKSKTDSESHGTNNSETIMTGRVSNTMELKLKFMNEFKTVNKIFVDRAWRLFDTTL